MNVISNMLTISGFRAVDAGMWLALLVDWSTLEDPTQCLFELDAELGAHSLVLGVVEAIHLDDRGRTVADFLEASKGRWHKHLDLGLSAVWGPANQDQLGLDRGGI